MKRLVLIAFLIMEFAASAQLLPPSLSCRRYTVANGIPSSEVYGSYQDRNGFVWVCTDRGISRFDGYRFKLFTINNGLVDNVVFSMYEDFKGRIWAVSLSGNLCYFENGRFHPYKYNHLIQREVRNEANTSKYIRLEKNGTLVYSCRNLGSFNITPSGKLTYNYKHLGRKYYVIEWLENDMLFPQLKVHVRAAQDLPDMQVSRNGKLETFFHTILSYDLRAVVHDHHIFGIENRMPFLLVNGRMQPLADLGVAISIFSDGTTLWVGYYKGGVRRFRMDWKNGRLLELSHFFPQESISSVNRDSEGSYWFTSLDNGVFYAPSLASTYLNTANGLLEKNVYSINGIGTSIYVTYTSTSVQGLSRPWARLLSTKRRLCNIGIFRNRIVITGFPGVEKKYPQLLNIESEVLYNQKAMAAEITANDRGMIVDAGGLIAIDPAGNMSLIYDPAMDSSSSRQESFDAIVTDDRYQLYAGNEKGLFKIVDQHVKDPDHPNRLFRYRVSDLVYDPRWQIVVATREKGVYFVNRDQVTGRITEASGLLSNQVNCVYVDHAGRLWVGSNRGVNMVERINGKYRIRQFSTRNGLLSDEINSIYVYGDRAWIATKAGICIIRFNEMPKASSEKRVFLNEISTLRSSTSSPAMQYFESGTPYIGITFRTTNFKGAPYHSFKYRLNAASPWVMTYEPEITLNAPAAGDYNIEVIYRNEDGSWVSPKTICSFSIDSPFWTKWYFITALALMGMVIVYFIFRYRVKQIGKRHFYESTINQLEQKALSAQMNPHFIFNSLNSIQSFLIYEENEKAEKYLLKFSSLIRQTLSNSRERFIRIEQEMTILKDYLELEQMRFRGKFSYELQSFLSQNEMAYFLPPMLIQPYVENAIIHGVANLKSGGLITVIFEMASESELRIRIDDNGTGRKKSFKKSDSKHRSFGTTITQERLRYFNKQSGDNFRIEITDKTENGRPTGTAIALTLPILKHYDAEDGSNY